MKIFSYQDFFFNAALAWRRSRATLGGGFIRALFGLALLVGALAPTEVLAAASWSSAPVVNVPVNTPTTYTMTGLAGSYSMWYRPVYFYDDMYFLGQYPYDRSDYGAWTKMGQTQYVGDTHITASISWTATVVRWQIKVVAGLNSATGQAVSWSSPFVFPPPTLLNVTVSSSKVFQQKPVINSSSIKAWSNGALYPGPYIATAQPPPLTISGSPPPSGPLVWQLYTGSTAPNAAINSSTGQVTATGKGTVKFYVYRDANAQCNASPPSNVFTLQIQDVLPQAAVTITSPTSTSQGAGYYATATGGNGTGALFWSLGTESTAPGVKIGDQVPGVWTSSSSAITATGPGTAVINVYRAADSFYLQSATATMTLSVSGPVAAITKSAGEAVTISSAVQGAGSSVTFAVVNAEGSSPGIALTGGSAASIGESPSVVNAIIKPGKEYTISVQCNNCTDYWLNFTPPAGYILLLDGKATNSLRNTPPSTSALSFNHRLVLRPEASFAGAPIGFFSGVRVDKAISWEIGLGNLRNGRSAGRLIFKENTLSDSPVSRAKLFYAPPDSYSEIDVKFDGSGNVLRQIQVPQGFLDIVDDPVNGGYWLKFYPRSASIVSTGGASTALFTVPAELVPWKTIRVELTAQGQLKFTEKEI